MTIRSLLTYLLVLYTEGLFVSVFAIVTLSASLYLFAVMVTRMLVNWFGFLLLFAINVVLMTWSAGLTEANRRYGCYGCWR
jgi:hypothetical protein